MDICIYIPVAMLKYGGVRTFPSGMANTSSSRILDCPAQRQTAPSASSNRKYILSLVLLFSVFFSLNHV